LHIINHSNFLFHSFYFCFTVCFISFLPYKFSSIKLKQLICVNRCASSSVIFPQLVDILCLFVLFFQLCLFNFKILFLNVYAHFRYILILLVYLIFRVCEFFVVYEFSKWTELVGSKQPYLVFTLERPKRQSHMQFCDTYKTEVEMNIPLINIVKCSGLSLQVTPWLYWLFQYCTRHFWHSHARSYVKCFGTTMHCTFLKRAKSRHRLTFSVIIYGYLSLFAFRFRVAKN